MTSTINRRIIWLIKIFVFLTKWRKPKPLYKTKYFYLCFFRRKKPENYCQKCSSHYHKYDILLSQTYINIFFCFTFWKKYPTDTSTTRNTILNILIFITFLSSKQNYFFLHNHSWKRLWMAVNQLSFDKFDMPLKRPRDDYTIIIREIWIWMLKSIQKVSILFKLKIQRPWQNVVWVVGMPFPNNWDAPIPLFFQSDDHKFLVIAQRCSSLAFEMLNSY